MKTDRDADIIRKMPRGTKRDREAQIRRTARAFGLPIELIRKWERKQHEIEALESK